MTLTSAPRSRTDTSRSVPTATAKLIRAAHTPREHLDFNPQIADLMLAIRAGRPTVISRSSARTRTGQRQASLSWKTDRGTWNRFQSDKGRFYCDPITPGTHADRPRHRQALVPPGRQTAGRHHPQLACPHLAAGQRRRPVVGPRLPWQHPHRHPPSGQHPVQFLQLAGIPAGAPRAKEHAGDPSPGLPGQREDDCAQPSPEPPVHQRDHLQGPAVPPASLPDIALPQHRQTTTPWTPGAATTDPYATTTSTGRQDTSRTADPSRSSGRGSHGPTISSP